MANAVAMAPKFDEMLLPLLRFLGDGHEHPVREVEEHLARYFALTSADLAERTPSRRKSTFKDRVGWAGTYLNQAGLLIRPTRAVYRITERGRDVLRQNPPRLDQRFLEQFPEFRECKSRKTGVPGAPIQKRSATDLTAPGATPEAALDRMYQDLRDARVAQVLERLRAARPARFEQIVADFLVALGYRGARPEAGQRIGRAGEGRVDSVITEDRLGLETIYVQAMQRQESVSEDAVRSFAGALMAHRASKGVFLTTSDFTREAREYVDKIEKRIALVDGSQFARLMYELGVGLIDEAQYVIKNLDPKDFSDE